MIWGILKVLLGLTWPYNSLSQRDQAENFSQKWIELCAKHFSEQHSSEAYKQNQNFVERWVQEAKTTITQVKQHTGCDDQYSFDMWSHVSDVNNHCAWKSPSGAHPWRYSAMKLQISLSSGMRSLHLYGIGNLMPRLER